MAASTSASSALSAAEEVARSAKSAFDAAQLLEDGHAERVRALELVREALQANKQLILDANAKDMDVRIQSTSTLLSGVDLNRWFTGGKKTGGRWSNVQLASETLGSAIFTYEIRRYASRRRGCRQPPRSSGADYLRLET
jgi:hypothetical protein